MIQIIPAILTNDFREFEEMLERCTGVVDRVQIDVIDGVFVDNKTVDLDLFANLETDLNLDFHLMVKEPINWVEKCIRADADRIIGQIEQMENQVEFVGKVQSVGARVGLAIDIQSPVSSLDPTILTNLDVVLVMGVPAGFGGQKFDKKTLNKIKELDKIRVRDKSPYKICLDGGQTLLSVNDVHASGADEAAIGKRLFEGDLIENLKKFQRAAHGL